MTQTSASPPAEKPRSIDWARYGTGFSLVSLVVVTLFLGPVWVWLGFVLAAQILGLREFHTLLEARSIQPLKPQVFFYSLGLSILGAFELEEFFTPALALSLFTMGYQRILWPRNLRGALPDIGCSLLAILYVGVLPAHVMLLRGFRHGTVWGACILFWLLTVVYAGDTGAYLIGRRFGRTKMAPMLSPKKSWEGIIGGVAVAAMAGVVFKGSCLPQLPLAHIPALVALISFFAHTGDLIESMMKRSVKVKDTGDLLPGHGGVLDRIDSLLMCAPVYYLYLVFVLKW